MRATTATSAFGVGRREGHDASAFYARFTAPTLSDDTELRRPRTLDALWCHDASQMDAFVEDKSVALVVTSPPYFAGKAYEAEVGTGHVPADYEAYLDMLYRVFEQCLHKLEPGGRIAVNVANLGRKPFRSLAADVTDILQRLGFLLRGEVVWRKSAAAGGSCAWGTYQRPANPVLRDVTERVILASKGRFDRAGTPEWRAAEGFPHEASITKDEFVDATTDVWELPAASATRTGHPAPFPVELPQRLIELFTYRGDLVVDPFMGAGTTAVAAVRTGRHYAGFDTDAGYLALAEERIAAERTAVEASIAPRVIVPAGRGGAVATLDDLVRAGERASEVAHRLLADAGFTKIEGPVVFKDLGVGVTYRALDRQGQPWLFEVCGAFSSTRPGLGRRDVLLRTIGTAGVLAAARTADPQRADLGPLVVLSTDRPMPRGPAGRMLAAVCGPGRAIHDVIVLLSPDDRLRELAQGAPHHEVSAP